MIISDEVKMMIAKYKEGNERVEAAILNVSDSMADAIIKDYNPPLNMIARDIVDMIIRGN